MTCAHRRECYHYILGLVELAEGSGSRRQFADIGRQRDAGCLEDIPHLARNVGAGGNDLAVLFDGGFLKAIEIVEERLPFGLKPFS